MEERLHANVEAYNLRAGDGQSLSFSLGAIWEDATSDVTMEELLSKADKAMYAHKMSRKRPA
jgi:GGDEF domain-containing protein